MGFPLVPITRCRKDRSTLDAVEVPNPPTALREPHEPRAPPPGMEAAMDRQVRRSKVAAVSQGVFVFGVSQLLFGMGGLPVLAVMLAVGSVVGIVWFYTDAGPLICAATGTPVFMLVTIAFASSLQGMFVLPGGALMAVTCLIVGHRRLDQEIDRRA